MRKIATILLAVVGVLIVALAIGWGSDSGSASRGPGEACTPTPEGANVCQSNVCLQDLRCQSGKVLPGVCGGQDCSASQTCSISGHECVTIQGAGAYCVPASVCN